jgi:hypothetical protein
MSECSMKDILAQGYVPYYGSVSDIPEGTEIVIQKNEEDFNINIFKMRPTYHTPIVKSDRAYKVNAVITSGTYSYEKKYTLYDTNNPDAKLEIPQSEITTDSTTLRKYSLYIPKETNDEINKKLEVERKHVYTEKEIQDNDKFLEIYYDNNHGGGGSENQENKSQKNVQLVVVFSERSLENHAVKKISSLKI